MVIPSNTVQAVPECVTYFVGSGTCLSCDTTYYEQTMYNRPGQIGGNSGCPIHNTVFTSVNNAGMSFLMPPSYTTNDDLSIVNSGTYGVITNGTFEFTTATTATNLAILCTGGNGGAVVGYTVTHSDASTETGSLTVPDWFNGGSNTAWGCNGRMDNTGDFDNFNNSTTNDNPPYLYGLQITVSGASPVASIAFTYTSGGGVDNFFAVSGNASGSTWTPIPVTGFNVMSLIPAPIPFPLTATVDAGTNIDGGENDPGNTWFEQGYYQANTTYGLPPSGSTFTSAVNGSDTYQMPNYHTGNNAILVYEDVPTANVALATPSNYSAFSFLTSGGNGGCVLQVVIQHADGVNETNSYVVNDWFNAASAAWVANGRIQFNNRTFQNIGSGDPKLFEEFVVLTDRNSAVTNIALSWVSGTGDTVLFAISAAAYNALPPVLTSEPASTVAFVGSNVTLRATAIGYQPLTYQWYGPETGGASPPTGLITGATNATLTLESLSAANAGGYYVVVTDANGLSTTSGTAPSGVASGALLNVISNPFPTSSYFSAVIGLNPLAYWPLNETNAAPAWPAIATNLGSLGAAGNAIYSGSMVFQSSPDQTNGGNCVLGDGGTTQVVVPYQPAVATVPCTLEAWLAPSAGWNAGECLFSDGDPGDGVGSGNPTGFWLLAGFNINANGNSALNLVGNNGTGTPSVNITVTNVPPSVWYDFTVTIANNPASNSPATGYITTFYINGTNAASEISDFVPNADLPLKIGDRSDDPFSGAYNYLGEMDQVAFYPSALSAATILAHYQAGTNPTPPTAYSTLVMNSDPLIYLKLNEPTPNYPAIDTGPIANNYGSTGAFDNGIYQTGTFPGSVPGPKAKGFPSDNVAVAFNHIYNVPGGAGTQNGTATTGTAGFVDVPVDTYNSLDLSGAVTLAAWVQATPDDGDRFETFAGRGDVSYRMDVDGTSDDLFHFAYGSGNDQVGVAPYGSGADGNWHFVVGVWDTTNEYLYVDGLSNSASSSTGLPTGGTDDFTIGEAPDDTYRIFDGNIAEVAIFSYALSAAQIESLYQAAGASVVIIQQPLASQTVGAGENATFAVVAAGGNPTLSYQWFYDGAPVTGAEFAGATTPTLTLTSAEIANAGSYSVVVTNNGSSVTSAFSVLNVVQAPIITTPLLATNYSLLGSGISLSAGVISQAPTTNAWYLNGVLVANGGAISGATSDALVLSSVSPANAGDYTFTTTNAFGGASTSGELVLLPISEPTFGTNGAYWTVNNNGVNSGQGEFTSNDVFQITTANGDEDTAIFFDVPMYIGGFKASWTYQDLTPGTGGADGGTFCIQNSAAGPLAIGTQGANGGSGGGYSAITNSVALQWEIYAGSPGTPGLRWETNGSSYSTTLGAPYTDKPYGLLGAVDLTNGDNVFFDLLYDGETLTVTVSDTNIPATYTTNYLVGSIAKWTQSDTAFIGFTGGTGGATSLQTIGSFSFTPLPVLSSSVSNATLTLNWPLGNGVGAYTLQSATSLSGTWTAVAGPYNVADGQYQYQEPIQTAGNEFYRLVLLP